MTGYGAALPRRRLLAPALPPRRGRGGDAAGAAVLPARPALLGVRLRERAALAEHGGMAFTARQQCGLCAVGEGGGLPLGHASRVAQARLATVDAAAHVQRAALAKHAYHLQMATADCAD